MYFKITFQLNNPTVRRVKIIRILGDEILSNVLAAGVYAKRHYLLLVCVCVCVRT